MKTVATPLKETSKFQYIDCIRGVAILMVIANHADWYIPNINPFVQTLSDYGMMGVQLFFVASAFTLCLSMDRRKQDETLKTFYLRRYFRIAPLYYIGIPLYLCYYSFIRPIIEGQPVGIAHWYTFPNILANLLLLNDFVPGAANTKVVPGGWSIGTEATFYAIFPVIFMLYHKYRKHNQALILFPFLGLVLSILSIHVLEFVATDIVGYENFYYFREKSSFLYFNLLCQLPVFLTGMSLYFRSLTLRQATMRDKYNLFFAFAGFTFIAMVININYSSLLSLRPFVPAVAFFFLFLLFKEVPALSNKLLARIGQLSYSIYLFHFLIAFAGSRFLYHQLNGYLSPDVIFLLSIVLTTVLAMGIAVLSEKYIEKPGIELGKRIISRVKSSRLKLESLKNNSVLHKPEQV